MVSGTLCSSVVAKIKSTWLGGSSSVFSSALRGDPATPLLEAFAGDAVRIHVLAPSSEQAHVFHRLAGQRLQIGRQMRLLAPDAAHPRDGDQAFDDMAEALQKRTEPEQSDKAG